MERVFMPYFVNQNHKLHYREKGTGNLLLILPGNTASSNSHLDDITYFSNYFHVVSLDFWGTGKSDRLKDWTRNWWMDAVKDTIALVEHLNYDAADVIGCSGGAAIALLMATLYPNKVRSVIADSELEQYQYEDMIRLCLEERKLPSKEQVDFWKSAHGDDWPDVIQEDNKLMLDFANNGHIFKDKLKNIVCPVLFCGSLEEEKYVPYFSETIVSMAKQIQKAELYLINDGNHPLMWTCKKQFRITALTFLHKTN